MRAPRLRCARAAAIVLAALLLAGCAAQKAYQDGEDLVAQGKVDEGLAKLQQAAAADPKDARYRSAFLQTRERVLATYAEQADQLAARGATEQARAMYRRALAVEPRYQRALDGLAALDAGVRQSALLDAADALAKANQMAAAREKLARVLAESPANARALAIRRALDDHAAAVSPEAVLAQTYRKPVTIEFKDATLKQVFEVIARGAGLNFLFDKDVKTDQRTSIFLKNSTIEQAVRYVLLTNQLEQQVLDGNTVLIYPNTAAKQKDYQQLDVRTFYLTNSEAKTVANTLKTILKSRDVVVDEKLNLLIVRDTPDAIRMAERLVALQDVPEPEVMLEVEVIEVQKDRLQNLGIQWPATVGLTPLSLGSVINSVSSTGTTTSTGSTGPALSLYDFLHQTRNSVGVSVGQTTINANVTDSDAKLLTNPRIRVKNHEKAKILIGERVPNITSTATSTGFLSQSVNYIDVGLTLNVEPTIYLDDDVGIKISLEVSSLINQVATTSGTTAYNIGTRTATTSLRLKNGETDVLAGLIDSQERTSGNKVPGVGELPIVGRLFGASTDDDQKTEIVLSITPHLIRNIQRPDAAEANFHSGTDSGLHATPDGLSGASTPYVPPVSTPPATTGTGNTPASAPAVGQAGDASSGAGASTGGSTAAATADTGVAPDTSGAAGSAQLQWQGPAQVAAGGTVTLNLLTSSTLPVASMPLTLGFNSAKLQLVSVTEGPFMKQAGATTSFSSRLLSDGQLALSDATSSGTGASAQAVFATVTFKALSAVASTNVTLLSSSPAATGGAPIAMAAPAPYALRIN